MVFLASCYSCEVAVNRTLYLTLWVFVVVAIVGLVLALTLPIQDYALKEFLEWRQHPSPETYKAFLEKQRQERAVRFIVAVPFGVAAVLLTGPLRKYRRK
jgi:hypothetical protein